MKYYLLCLLLLNSCAHQQLVLEKPKLKPSAVIHPTFEGYALTLQIRWDVVNK